MRFSHPGGFRCDVMRWCCRGCPGQVGKHQAEETRLNDLIEQAGKRELKLQQKVWVNTRNIRVGLRSEPPALPFHGCWVPRYILVFVAGGNCGSIVWLSRGPVTKLFERPTLAAVLLSKVHSLSTPSLRHFHPTQPAAAADRAVALVSPQGRSLEVVPGPRGDAQTPARCAGHVQQPDDEASAARLARGEQQQMHAARRRWAFVSPDPTGWRNLRSFVHAAVSSI